MSEALQGEAKKGGRPTKLTPELQEKVVECLRRGNYRQVAAAYVGIPPTTMSHWMSRPGEPYEAFQQAVIEAENSVESWAVGAILEAGKADVNHLKWWLERKLSERWGRKLTIDSVQLRKMAEQVASESGLPVESLIAEAERIAAGASSR